MYDDTFSYPILHDCHSELIDEYGIPDSNACRSISQQEQHDWCH